jgi:hypothetical protein
MVLYERQNDVVCIGQASHAWVSGQLARHWGNADFATPDPFEEVCLGAEQHDIGMAEWDVHPTLNPGTGYPYDFLALPKDIALSLWADSPAKVLTQSPYAAVLVSMHGVALSEGKPERQDYIAHEERFQQRLLAKLHEDPARVRRNQLLVWAVDYLALAALTGWTPRKAFPAPDHTLHVEEPKSLHLTVDPWPLNVPALTVPYRGRVLDAPSPTQAELDARLDAAPWTDILVTWTPA